MPWGAHFMAIYIVATCAQHRMFVFPVCHVTCTCKKWLLFLLHAIVLVEYADFK